MSYIESQPKDKQQFKSFFTEDLQSYTFYFDLNPNLEVVLPLRASTLAEDALIAAIEAANKLLKSRGVQLVEDIKLYKLRLTARNLRPKMDLPCLALQQKICDLKITKFAVQFLDQAKAIKNISLVSTEKVSQINQTSIESDHNKIENEIVQLEKKLENIEVGNQAEVPTKIEVHQQVKQ